MKTARGLESKGADKNGRIHKSRANTDGVDESFALIGMCMTHGDQSRARRGQEQWKEMKRWMGDRMMTANLVACWLQTPTGRAQRRTTEQLETGKNWWKREDEMAKDSRKSSRGGEGRRGEGTALKGETIDETEWRRQREAGAVTVTSRADGIQAEGY